MLFLVCLAHTSSYNDLNQFDINGLNTNHQAKTKMDGEKKTNEMREQGLHTLKIGDSIDVSSIDNNCIKNEGEIEIEKIVGNENEKEKSNDKSSFREKEKRIVEKKDSESKSDEAEKKRKDARKNRITKKKAKDDRRTKLNEYEDKPDYEVYNFKDSGDGKSWQLGNESSLSGNAFIGGNSKCPEDIIVPRSLTSKKGETRPVEVIGRWAYHTCGASCYGGKTKTVLVTKQVRIIKYYGFGDMHNVESFRIEEGSVLETIEQYALGWIGYETGQNDVKKRGTLTLPSTLSSVAQNGIYWCNLFKIIIYCGNNSLTSPCQLYYGSKLEKTKVRVTDQYSRSTIFDQTPLYDSPTEVEGNCSQMALLVTSPRAEKASNYTSLSKVLLSVLSSGFLLSDSDSDYDSYSISNSISHIDEDVEGERREGRRRKRSSLGVETEVILVIKKRKRDHIRGNWKNELSKLRLLNYT